MCLSAEPGLEARDLAPSTGSLSRARGLLGLCHLGCQEVAKKGMSQEMRCPGLVENEAAQHTQHLHVGPARGSQHACTVAATPPPPSPRALTLSVTPDDAKTATLLMVTAAGRHRNENPIKMAKLYYVHPSLKYLKNRGQEAE